MARGVVAVSLAGMGVVAAVGLAAGSANADPAGSVTLAGGSSGEPDGLRTWGADSAGIIYSVSDPHSLATPIFYLRSAAGTVSPLPSAFDTDDALAGEYDLLAGSMAGTYVNQPGRNFTYTSIDGSVHGTLSVPSTQTFLNPSPDGYLYSEIPSGATEIHVYDMDVSTAASTDLGAVPGVFASVTAAASTTGVVVEGQPSTGEIAPVTIFYVSLEHLGTMTELAAEVPTVGAPAFDADSVAWIENPTTFDDDEVSYDASETTVVRMNLDGSDEQRTAVPDATQIAITPGFTGFFVSPSYDVISFDTMPATGGAPVAYPVTPISYDLKSGGNDFLVDLPGSPATAGLYSLPSATGPATEVVPAGSSTLNATSIATSPGRVVWVDNGVGAGVWNRNLSTSSGSLVAAPPTIISPLTSQVASSSGSSTAWITGDPVFPSTESVFVSTPNGIVQLPGVVGYYELLTLSGSRLLENMPDGSAVLDDLVDDTSVTLPASPGVDPNFGGPFYQLWGDELAWVDGDGSVWFEDLSTGTTTLVSGPIASTDQVFDGKISLAAGVVAWSGNLCSDGQQTGLVCTSEPLRHRNILTGGPILTASADEPSAIDVSDSYIAFNDENQATQTDDLYVVPVGGGARVDVGPLDPFSLSFSMSGSTIGWLGSDQLPHVLALPHLAAQPWYLGDGSAPTTFSLSGASSWTGDFVASTSLTRCSVSISLGSISVRTLPCNGSGLAVGEATVSWDGTDGSGAPVASGSYTWTLSGSGADGPLMNADGTSRPITGTIAVTAPTPATGGGGSAPTPTPSVTASAPAPTLPTPAVTRVSGSNRFGTAVAASEIEFPKGDAGAVVLARADDDADALVGGPLAAAKNAPLLLTSGGSVPSATLQELTRVLPAGGTVYLIGGTNAVPASVQNQLDGLGFTTVRLAGADRYATAVAVAGELGNPATVLLATGIDFPDALAAGPAATNVHGAVLLTDGGTMPSATAAYLKAHSSKTYAIGGPAAMADSAATPILGADRYATAVNVAKAFFSTPSSVGLATGTGFADALAAGAILSRDGAPLLLTTATGLPQVTGDYLRSIEASVTEADIFGGESAIATSVQVAVQAVLGE